MSKVSLYSQLWNVRFLTELLLLKFRSQVRNSDWDLYESFQATFHKDVSFARKLLTD